MRRASAFRRQETSTGKIAERLKVLHRYWRQIVESLRDERGVGLGSIEAIADRIAQSREFERDRGNLFQKFVIVRFGIGNRLGEFAQPGFYRVQLGPLGTRLRQTQKCHVPVIAQFLQLLDAARYRHRVNAACRYQ